MTNKECIKLLKREKELLNFWPEYSVFQLSNACNVAHIFLYGHSRSATFANGKIRSVDYLKGFPENQRRAASIAVIDASIKVVKELYKS